MTSVERLSMKIKEILSTTFLFLGKIFAVIKSQMDMLGSASLVHAGLTDLSGLEGLGDHLSHHHHAAAAAHHHYYAQVSKWSLVQTQGRDKDSLVYDGLSDPSGLEGLK